MYVLAQDITVARFFRVVVLIFFEIIYFHMGKILQYIQLP